MVSIMLIKQVASLVTSTGAGLIVGNAVKATTPATVTRLGKALITCGSLALGGIVADKAAEYTEKKIDEAVELVKDIDFDVEKDPNEENVT